MPDHPAQPYRFQRQERQKQRLAITRQRLILRAERRAQRGSREIQLQLRFPKSTIERARYACFRSEGVDLLTWLKQAVYAFSDTVSLKEAQESNTGFGLEDEDEWKVLITEYLDEIESDELTAPELLSAIDGEEVLVHPRSHLIRLGKLMRRLRWSRKQVQKGDRRVWVYQRPLLTKAPDSL